MKTTIKLNKYTNYFSILFGGILIGVMAYAMTSASTDNVLVYKDNIKELADNERVNISTYKKQWEANDLIVIDLQNKLNKAILERDEWANRGKIAKEEIECYKKLWEFADKYNVANPNEEEVCKLSKKKSTK